MEKEGLIRSVNYFESVHLVTAALITDRHPQIQKWIREQLAEVLHYYDVCHMAKGGYL